MDLYRASYDYRNSLKSEMCKKEGIYYTPEDIVKVMVSELFRNNKFESDYKVLDIACGCGLFYSEIIEYIASTYNDIYRAEDLIQKNIYAIEKDSNAINILQKFIKIKYGVDILNDGNLFNRDALFTEDYMKDGIFDFIFGNPPYVGHKNVESDYALKLRKAYADVYVNKSDVYYCFFKKAVELLKEGGICSYIVPRYFLESQSALNIRKYLEKNTEIIRVVDFRNSDVFDNNIGVSPCIITFKKVLNYVKKQKPQITIINNKEDLELMKMGKKSNNSGVLHIDQTSWSLITKDEERIMDAIWSKKTYKLGDIVKNYQGVITGYDKAFIVDSESELLNHIDSSICKKWIKSKDIGCFSVENSKISKKIIYTDNLEIEDMSLELRSHLEKYKYKLEKRREVLRGVRKWYELQWGRQYDIFEQPKIIYPFKSKNNRFAMDYGNSFFSADVYFFTIREEFREIISYEYLLCILNSKVYEKYLQSFLKKLGNSVYEYYPYRLLEADIFVDENYKDIENIGKIIIKMENKSEKHELIKKIDDILENSLKLTKLVKK